MNDKTRAGIRVSRTTSESEITVALDRGPRDPDAKRKLATPLPFFNHMLEHVAWRGQLNLDVSVRLDHFELAHLVTEDVGICLGRAIKEYVEQNAADGIIGYGSAFGVIDEAVTRVLIAFENRAFLDFDRREVVLPEAVEGMQSEDLVAFFEGFVQGAQCTLHVDLQKGRVHHGHHIWESAFRGLGMALYEALAQREWRARMTAGVAGAISYRVETI